MNATQTKIIELCRRGERININDFDDPEEAFRIIDENLICYIKFNQTEDSNIFKPYTEMITIQFENIEDLRDYISLSIPKTVKPTKNTQRQINPFVSDNIRENVINSISQSLINKAILRK